jgi:hypothetical protein
MDAPFISKSSTDGHSQTETPNFTFRLPTWPIRKRDLPITLIGRPTEATFPSRDERNQLRLMHQNCRLVRGEPGHDRGSNGGTSRSTISKEQVLNRTADVRLDGNVIGMPVTEPALSR